jgi:ribosome biogenesis GTPase
VTNSYKEFLPFLGTCKFRDCKHENDKGCAIIQAVKDGHIAKFRLENYYQILKSMENDKPDAYVAPGRKYGK